MASTPSSPDEDGVASTAATKDRKEIVTLAVYKWSKHELAQRCCHENGLSCSNGLCFEYISYIERDDRVGYTDLETRHGNRPNGIGANGTSRKSNAKVVSLKDYAERAKKKYASTTPQTESLGTGANFCHDVDQSPAPRWISHLLTIYSQMGLGLFTQICGLQPFSNKLRWQPEPPNCFQDRFTSSCTTTERYESRREEVLTSYLRCGHI